jgi:hypothetical protein
VELLIGHEVEGCIGYQLNASLRENELITATLNWFQISKLAIQCI